MVGASAAWVGASLLHESEGGRDRSRLLAATEHHPHLGSGSSSRSARGRSTRVEAAELLRKCRAKGRTHEWWLDGKGRCGRSSGRHRPLRTGKGTAARASRYRRKAKARWTNATTTTTSVLWHVARRFEGIDKRGPLFDRGPRRGRFSACCLVGTASSRSALDRASTNHRRCSGRDGGSIRGRRNGWAVRWRTDRTA